MYLEQAGLGAVAVTKGFSKARLEVIMLPFPVVRLDLLARQTFTQLSAFFLEFS